MKGLWFAFVLAVIPTRVFGAPAAGLGLTFENIRTADRFHADLWNDGMPLIGGGVEMKLESGEVVFDREIRLLARWLKVKHRLPSMEELLPLIQDESMACRIFVKACLEWHVRDLPEYSPYYEPGSQPEKIARIEKGIRILIKSYPAAGKRGDPKDE